MQTAPITRMTIGMVIIAEEQKILAQVIRKSDDGIDLRFLNHDHDVRLEGNELYDITNDERYPLPADSFKEVLSMTPEEAAEWKLENARGGARLIQREDAPSTGIDAAKAVKIGAAAIIGGPIGALIAANAMNKNGVQAKAEAKADRPGAEDNRAPEEKSRKQQGEDPPRRRSRLRSLVAAGFVGIAALTGYAAYDVLQTPPQETAAGVSVLKTAAQWQQQLKVLSEFDQAQAQGVMAGLAQLQTPIRGDYDGQQVFTITIHDIRASDGLNERFAQGYSDALSGKWDGARLAKLIDVSQNREVAFVAAIQDAEKRIRTIGFSDENLNDVDNVLMPRVRQALRNTALKTLINPDFSDADMQADLAAAGITLRDTHMIVLKELRDNVAEISDELETSLGINHSGHAQEISERANDYYTNSTRIRPAKDKSKDRAWLDIDDNPFDNEPDGQHYTL